MAERSSDSRPPNQANYWPSYEDILGPFAGRVKQAIAKEWHSPACENLMNSPKRTEGTCR